MFERPSFFADIVHPSASRNISCAMSRGARPACPGSRSRISHAFSAKRQASR